MTTEYTAMQRKLCSGWNTWDTRSMMEHVLLPSGLALTLGIKDYKSGYHLRHALVGRSGPEVETVRPGMRSYDGSYTELTVSWRGIEARVQTALVDGDWVALITPLTQPRLTPSLIVEGGLLYNNPGHVALESGALIAYLPGQTIAVFGTRPSFTEYFVDTENPYLALPLDGPVGLSTGIRRSLAEIETAVAAQREAQLARLASYGELGEVYNAFQACLAWNTIYDPSNQRAISPVTRIWNLQRGGWVLFCWDTFFAAYLAAVDNKELAYANVVTALEEVTADGFVPNNSQANLRASRDRSQPPVGAMIAREVYRRYRETWFLEEIYEPLWVWNRWWLDNRIVEGDLMCWGSNPYDDPWEKPGNNDWIGGAFESGLDNSPMYDNVPFNPETHLLELADVGLMGLYVMDCEALADMARILGKEADAGELDATADRVRQALAAMWSPGWKAFLNQTMPNRGASMRVSPTNFYALLAGAATQEQAASMTEAWFNVARHLGGRWKLPSISRDDPAYVEQNYWRGRIWGPLNLLVYLGFRRYGLTQAQHDLAENSAELLLQEWLEHGHVHENYNADTGEGCDVARGSDRYYHWGGLLGLPAMIEAGFLDGWEQPL